MPIVFKTLVDGKPYTIGLRRDNLRDRLDGLQIDNGQIIIQNPTPEDLVILEAAVTRLRHCWVIAATESESAG